MDSHKPGENGTTIGEAVAPKKKASKKKAAEKPAEEAEA
jgi:small subunit ribosomal protein S1